MPSRKTAYEPGMHIVEIPVAAGLSSDQYIEVDQIDEEMEPLRAYHTANNLTGARAHASHCVYCKRDFRPALSVVEARVLQYINEVIAVTGKPPTFGQIENEALPRTGRGHSGRTAYTLGCLEAKGYIIREFGRGNLFQIPSMPLEGAEVSTSKTPIAIIDTHGWPNHYKKYIKGRRAPAKAPSPDKTKQRRRLNGRFLPEDTKESAVA